MSLSPLSPSAAQDSVQSCLQAQDLSNSGAQLSVEQHSTLYQMTHIRESPSSEEVDHCTQLPEVRQVAGADIPPDSPIRSMFVLC